MNWDEIRTAIRAVLIADATFAAFLASASSVYESEPGVALEDGSVTIGLTNDGPVTEASITGEYQPRIQINLYKSAPATLWAMRERLGALLEIPRERTTPITSSGYQIRTLTCFNALDLGKVKQLNENLFLRHVATEWRAKIVKL